MILPSLNTFTVHDDPVADLVVAIVERGKPDLAWIVRWDQSDDPVIAAWNQSRSGRAMITLRALANQDTREEFARDRHRGLQLRWSHTEPAGFVAIVVRALLKRHNDSGRIFLWTKTVHEIRTLNAPHLPTKIDDAGLASLVRTYTNPPTLAELDT